MIDPDLYLMQSLRLGVRPREFFTIRKDIQEQNYLFRLISSTPFRVNQSVFLEFLTKP